MTSGSIQLHRVCLLLLSAAGLLLLTNLLASGWLQTFVAQLGPSDSRMVSDMLERTPELHGFIVLAWFHYLLAFTLAACCVQVLASLLKAVRNTVLLTINWGIAFSTTAAMLFFWVFGAQADVEEFRPWMTAQIATICAALAMHLFARAFLAFPVPMTDDRFTHYQRRFEQRASGEFLASKRTFYGRSRRAMLAWEIKLGRKSARMRSVRLRRRMRTSMSLTPGQTRLMLLYLFPGMGLLALSTMWALLHTFGEAVEWAGALAVFPFLGMVYAWGVTMGKILMDYRLGDASVRKQVLWLLIGISFPAWMLGAFWIGLVAAILSPGVLPYLMLFMSTYVPLLAFLLFVMCLMVAIFFYGAVDPERVLRASALYSFLGLVLTVIFAVIEQLLSPLLTGAVGLDGTTGALASAVVVALSFRPVHRYIEAGIERTFEKLLYVAPALPPTQANSGAEATKSDPSASPG